MSTLVCNGAREWRSLPNDGKIAGALPKHGRIIRRVRFVRGNVPGGRLLEQDTQIMKREVVFGDYY